MRRAVLSIPCLAIAAGLALVAMLAPASSARTQKPTLYAKTWLAITGKPLAATAGARMFEKGGNAVDAACAMLAATCTMWDTLAWGGETQALVFNPKTGKVIGVNALGVAPSGATAEFFRSKGLSYPPEYVQCWTAPSPVTASTVVMTLPMPAPSILSVVLLGAGPGLYFDFARFNFQIPTDELP